ncbi:uncharacterized protein LOC113116060 isoform X2 [Carassius auratus]|uniref:Uncharacterized protein LOC113116060 isoform X2 n=1 Tax=Carassius auratus TaxID=7957 RepID=A0A6P6R294_CARAU|nr:uncharacterized protein LOC113116060 isoform X2 [Carassius auratus]
MSQLKNYSPCIGETMAATVKLFFVLVVEGIHASLICTVSVYQNQSVAYIISGPLPAPGCIPEWTAANTMLVDENGNIYHQVVLHAEPQRILTVGCQHHVAYRLECLAIRVFLVVNCNYKCLTVPIAVVTKDSAVEGLPGTGRTHVVSYAVIGIAVLGFVIMTVIYKYRHLRESVGAV